MTLAASAAPFLLTSSWSAACDREAASSRPEPRAAVQPPAPVSPARENSPPAGKGDDQKPPAAPPKEATPQRSGSGATRTGRTFVVYALSRGSGVPPDARAAQLKIQRMAEADRDRGLSVTIETTRIGLEGERRLCITYRDSRLGARALDRARAIVKGIDLVNLVVEPCTPPPSKTPKKEEAS